MPSRRMRAGTKCMKAAGGFDGAKVLDLGLFPTEVRQKGADLRLGQRVIARQKDRGVDKTWGSSSSLRPVLR